MELWDKSHLWLMVRSSKAIQSNMSSWVQLRAVWFSGGSRPTMKGMIVEISVGLARRAYRSCKKGYHREVSIVRNVWCGPLGWVCISSKGSAYSDSRWERETFNFPHLHCLIPNFTKGMQIISRKKPLKIMNDEEPKFYNKRKLKKKKNFKNARTFTKDFQTSYTL